MATLVFQFLSRKGFRFTKQHLIAMHEATSDDQASDHLDEDDDFFVKMHNNSTALTQLHDYLLSPSTETMAVASLPLNKRLFFETKTPLPTSAAYQHLFSADGHTFTPMKLEL